MQAEAIGAEALLYEAGRHLLAAAKGCSAAANVATALRAIILATDDPDHRPASPDLVSSLRDAFELAMPAVTEDASDPLPREHVAIAIGMASRLLDYLEQASRGCDRKGRHGSELCTELDHLALLASEPEAIACRRRIEARIPRGAGCYEAKMEFADPLRPDQVLH